MQTVRVRRSGGRSAAGEAQRGVHAEVEVLVDHRGGDQCRDRHERLGEHAAVADDPRLRLLLDHLRGGARGDQGVEAGQCAAGDGDEQEREQVAGEGRALAVQGEVGDSRHRHDRADDQDGQRQEDDGADLHEGRQVVAWGQQQPDRQDRGQEAVDGDGVRQLDGRQGEDLREGGMGVDDRAAGDGEDEQHHADGGRLADLAGPDETHVDTHQEGDRDRHRDREHAPRGRGQGADDDDRQHRDEDDHDGEHADDGEPAADGAEFVAGHLAERAPVPADRQVQHHVVLHRPGEHHADDDPDRAGQVAHLGGEDRADQRAGTGDGGEVVAEQDGTVGRLEVTPVGELLGRGRPGVVGAMDLAFDQLGVEAQEDQVRADGGKDEPHRTDVLATQGGDEVPGDGPDDAEDGEEDLLPGGDPRRLDHGDRGQGRVGLQLLARVAGD
ncbi:hypothetical protein SDC9_84827 [bioreactor metagenome]|uniref:Uncharacterized protein n=1 Tax=bioreactor metagenome TaxID=1076179 RepID=A0A644ZD27_9ZZZZ